MPKWMTKAKFFLLPYLKILLEKYSFVIYLIVGSFSTFIYFALFVALWQFLEVNYKISVSFAYFFAVVFHFTANRRYTFKAHGTDFFKQLTRYILMISFNYCVTLSIMYSVVEILHLSPYIGLVISIVTNINTNFLIARYWVFRIV